MDYVSVKIEFNLTIIKLLAVYNIRPHSMNMYKYILMFIMEEHQPNSLH